jgi:hypothetical protein
MPEQVESDEDILACRAVMAELRQLAVDDDCDDFHLDSGVQRRRAHQFCLREGLELAGYHCSERQKPRD